MPDITTIALPNQNVTVQSGGSGRPLLFLHGEADTSAWGPLHDVLSATHHVIAPVHPGFGGEETPAWLEDTSDYAFHYVDLVAALDLDAPLVVGESLGGWIAADLAIHRPDLLRGAVLLGPLGLRSATPVPDLFIMELPDAVSHLSGTRDVAQLDPITGDAELATRVWVELATQARIMWERGYDPRLDRRAHHATVPMALVCGSADLLYTADHYERYAALFGAEHHIIDGAGHMVGFDAPTPCGALVEAFDDRT